jgi:hypothetical protein
MAIKVNYSNSADKAAAYQAVKTYITPETLEKWKVKADITYEDQGQMIKAKGAGFELNINFLDTHAEATLNLSLLLRPLKGKIEESLEKQLKRVV